MARSASRSRGRSTTRCRVRRSAALAVRRGHQRRHRAHAAAADAGLRARFVADAHRADGDERPGERVQPRLRQRRPDGAERQLGQRALAVDELGARPLGGGERAVVERARQQRRRRQHRLGRADQLDQPLEAVLAPHALDEQRPRMRAEAHALLGRRLDVRQPVAAALPAEAGEQDLLGVAAQRREQLARLDQAQLDQLLRDAGGRRATDRACARAARG